VHYLVRISLSGRIVRYEDKTAADWSLKLCDGTRHGGVRHAPLLGDRAARWPLHNPLAFVVRYCDRQLDWNQKATSGSPSSDGRDKRICIEEKEMEKVLMAMGLYRSWSMDRGRRTTYQFRLPVVPEIAHKSALSFDLFSKTRLRDAGFRYVVM
jgi:hypothetical protein